MGRGLFLFRENNREPWFVAKDVCNILEIKNSRDTLNKCLDEDERGVDIIYTPGGNQEMTMSARPASIL